MESQKQIDVAGLLAGKVAVVTGGGTGIGGAMVRRFVEAGARVFFLEVDAELAAQNVAAAQALGPVLQGTISDSSPGSGHSNEARVGVLVGDVRDAATVAEFAEAAHEFGGGRVDVVVNNVGHFAPYKRFLDSGEDDWAVQHEICFQHVLRVTHAFIGGMVRRGSGSVLQVASVEGQRGIPGDAVYSAYKAGLINLTRSLAVELGGHGVRVNCLAPDMTHTPQTPMRDWHPDPAAPRSWIPLGRFADPEEQADAGLFLASDLARFVTGQTLAVDGGTMAASGWYRVRPDVDVWSNTPYIVPPDSLPPKE